MFGQVTCASLAEIIHPSYGNEPTTFRTYDVMRLINCRTYKLEEFLGSITPKYAILSHTWGQEEVSFAEFTIDLESAKHKAGFRKIEYTCKQALAENIDFAWVDASCIDKSSSAELSEAINSMFKWYALSTICYTYLPDVKKENFDEEFPRSRWFRRGWTLQELLAPTQLVFFDSTWQVLGSKREHAIRIHKITRIDVEVLQDDKMHEKGRAAPFGACCVAKRMAWASGRETTREEDIAYCLLGIFSVNMPLLYGEGQRAFQRLQQEIIRNLDDDSILAWGFQEDKMENKRPSDRTRTDRSVDWRYNCSAASMLAKSPQDFANCHELQYHAESISSFTITNLGLQIELPLVWFPFPRPTRSFDSDPNLKDPTSHWRTDNRDGAVGLLTCSTSKASVQLGIVLVPHDTNRNMEKLHEGPITRMERIKVMDTAFEHLATIRIRPREVVGAITEKIIIVEPETEYNTRLEKYRYFQIVPQTSNSLRSTFGYRIIAASISHDWIGTQREKMEQWDPDDEVLMVPADDFARQFFEREHITFGFQSKENRQYPVFSVVVEDEEVTVHEGLNLSGKEKFAFFDSAAYYAQHLNDEESEAREFRGRDVILTDKHGLRQKVEATVKFNSVHLWKTIEVNIDTVNWNRAH